MSVKQCIIFNLESEFRSSDGSYLSWRSVQIKSTLYRQHSYLYINNKSLEIDVFVCWARWVYRKTHLYDKKKTVWVMFCFILSAVRLVWRHKERQICNKLSTAVRFNSCFLVSREISKHEEEWTWKSIIGTFFLVIGCASWKTNLLC